MPNGVDANRICCTWQKALLDKSKNIIFLILAYTFIILSHLNLFFHINVHLLHSHPFTTIVWLFGLIYICTVTSMLFIISSHPHLLYCIYNDLLFCCKYIYFIVTYTFIILYLDVHLSQYSWKTMGWQIIIYELHWVLINLYLQQRGGRNSVAGYAAAVLDIHITDWHPIKQLVLNPWWLSIWRSWLWPCIQAKELALSITAPVTSPQEISSDAISKGISSWL